MAFNFPPGMVLIAAALLIALTPGRAHRAWSLIAPLVALFGIWAFPAEGRIVHQWLDYELVLAQFNLPTKTFASVFALLALVGSLFAYNQDRRLELASAMLYAGSAIGVTFAGDLITLFLYWELMAIGSTLVIWSAKGEGARLAGRRYVNVHLLGGAIFMAGIAMHVHASGSILIPRMVLGGSLEEPVRMIAEGGGHWLLPTLDSPGAVLMLIGVLINAGAPPFGAWLPDAYPEASPSGTVFLSAFTTKTSVYVLLVLFAGSHILVWIGCLMAIYGLVYAVLENDMRRLLAYSIINQVGFMVAAVGIGTGLALNGATAHAFAHIVYKGLLLMSAGSVLFMVGKRKCSELGGLHKAMPVTMALGLIGALAVGAPLTSSFATKSMIIDAAALTELWAPIVEVDGQLAWAGPFHPSLLWFVLVATSAGVFWLAGIKFCWLVFFHKPAPANEGRKLDPPANMLVAMALLAALCIAVGVAPGPLYAMLPFQLAGEGELYQPYTYAHVVNQLQLLLFSGLAFFLLLRFLRGTQTITLDADWLYRRMIPAMWQYGLRPLLLAFEPIHRGIVQGLPRVAAREVEVTFDEDHGRAQGWGVTRTVLFCAVMLLIFLLLNLF